MDRGFSRLAQWCLEKACIPFVFSTIRSAYASPEYPFRPGIHLPSSSIGTGAPFPRLKRSEPEVHHLPLCNAEAKNESSCILTSLYAVMNGVRKDSTTSVPSLRLTPSWRGTYTANPDFVYLWEPLADLPSGPSGNVLRALSHFLDWSPIRAMYWLCRAVCHSACCGIFAVDLPWGGDR